MVFPITIKGKVKTQYLNKEVVSIDSSLNKISDILSSEGATVDKVEGRYVRFRGPGQFRRLGHKLKPLVFVSKGDIQFP